MFTGMTLSTLPGELQKEYHLPKKPEVQISRSFTTASETPVPVDLGPSGVYSASTGQIILMRPTASLVHDAARYINDLAVLPINEDDERIVDQLIANKLATLKAKPLTRKG